MENYDQSWNNFIRVKYQMVCPLYEINILAEMAHSKYGNKIINAHKH